jgi:hypothetical protein
MSLKQRMRSALAALEQPELASQAHYSLRIVLESLPEPEDVEFAYRLVLEGRPCLPCCFFARVPAL